MKRNHTDPSRILLLAVVTSFCSLIVVMPASAQSKQLKKLVGAWELSAKNNPNDKRLITFAIKDGQVAGTYASESGQNLPIAGITFAAGKYSFRVSDAQLVFRDFKFIGRKLEGVKFMTESAKSRSVPQVVQMIKKTPPH